MGSTRRGSRKPSLVDSSSELELELADHQRANCAWIGRVRRGLLADEPGLGKSASAIRAFDGGRVLVVAPSMVIVGGTWSDELHRWAVHPERFVVTNYQGLNQRIRTGNGTGSRPTDQVKPEFLGDWDAVIVDEAHYIKGRKTSWTLAVEQIAKRSDAFLAMTGTPIPNWAHELYTLLRNIYPDEAKRGTGKFGGYWRWVGEWFDVSPSQFSSTGKVIGELLACTVRCFDRPATDPCEHYYDFVRANLGDRFMRHLRDDVLDLPPLLGPQEILTPMDTDQARMYRELKKDYLTHNADKDEVIAWTPGARNVLLDRLTTSPWFLGDKSTPPGGGKLERLRFDLSSRSRPTLVLAHYRETVEACAMVASSTGATARFIHGGVSNSEKSRIVTDFKAGKVDVLVGSLETLAEGLTLTQADMAIFVEKSYKPSRNEQALRRIHRMGQTRTTTAIEYVTPNTVDQHKRELLATKNDRTMRVLTAAQFGQIL